MTLEKFVREMADPAQPLRHSGLVLLSGLRAEELEAIRPWWERVPDLRRQEMVARLVDLTEENTDLDFHTFFCYCTGDPDPVVREEAISGLWESEDRSLIPLLIVRLAQDDTIEVRAAAAIGLGRFATLSQRGKLLARDTKRVYRALLGVLSIAEEPLDVRRRALESLGAFQSEEVTRWLMWGYHNEEVGLRQSALYGMGRSLDSSWLAVICHEMHNVDPAMRYEAANACCELGGDEAVPHLADLIEDEDLQVRLSAVQALGAIGGTSAKKLLRGCSQSDEDAVREAAEAVLEMMETEEGLRHSEPPR